MPSRASSLVLLCGVLFASVTWANDPLDEEVLPAEAPRVDEPAPLPSAGELVNEHGGEKEAPSTAPAETTPPPDLMSEADAVVPLVERADAQAAFASCFDDTTPEARTALRTCLKDVAERHPGTPAGFRAEGALRTLSLDEETPVVEGGFQIPPGRLELSATAGLFGI